MGQPRITAGKHTPVGHELLRGVTSEAEELKGHFRVPAPSDRGSARERPGGLAESGCLHLSSREFYKCRASRQQGRELG